MTKVFILLMLLIILVQDSYAQPKHLSFDHLNVPTGLPEGNVQSILQDSQGYIWLTTQNGIVRYDGYRVKIYKPGAEDKTNVPSLIFCSILQDSKGEIWVNSFNNGLFKFDRSTDSFIQYKNKSLDNKGSQFRADIDFNGKIWSQIHFGDYRARILEQFDPLTGLFKRYGSHQKGRYYLNFKQLNKCYIDHRGRLWLGTDNGVYRYDPSSNSFTGYLTSSDTLQQKNIKVIYQGPLTPNELWLGIENKKDTGSYYLERMNVSTGNTTSFEYQLKKKNNLGNDIINAVFEDQKRRLWIGTGSGLLLYNSKANQFTKCVPDSANSSHEITSITADADGKLWMTSAHGLLCFNPETRVFRRYVHDNDDPASLADNKVNRLYFDQKGILWVTVSWGGVDRVNPTNSAFSPLNAWSNRFPWHGLHAVAQAPDGQWWIAAHNGLYRYNKGKQTLSLIDNVQVSRLFIGKSGIVYYNAFDSRNKPDGLRVLDPQSGKTERYKNIPGDPTSLANNDIQAILEDHAGVVWVGTHGDGVCALNRKTKKFRCYPYIINDNTKISHNVLDHNVVASLYDDKAGTLWVGTDAGGLNHLDRNRDMFISSYRPQEGLVSITSMTQDRNGKLWAGTYLNGLFLVDNRTGRPLRRFTEKDGLLMDEVLFIYSSNDNFIWICSERGFTRVNINDYSTKTFKADGNNWQDIFYNVSTGYDKINVISAVDGNLLFFGGNDMVSFDFGAIKKDVNPPVVHIEDLAYTDPRSAKDSSMVVQNYGQRQKELPWNENKVTFHYVALHYADPGGTNYSYRLEGYDNRWVQGGTQRSATYTNLPPGAYTFRVKAANSDGIWNNRGDSFIIIINPPWWQTWWAWALWSGLFVFAIYAFITYRSRKLLRDKKVLEHKVNMRTEEVMQQKEEIETQRDNIEKALVELKSTQNQLIQREKMASLGELTTGIAHEIQNPLNFVNNFSEVSAELIDELDDELDKGDITEAKAIAGDVKQNLEKILLHGKRADNIVSGMLEHSRSSKGEKTLTNINALADEFLKLSYHGFCAKDKLFSADIVTDFYSGLPKINVVSQDIGRVLLNLFNNAFYAVNQKKKTAGGDYKPLVSAETLIEKNKVVIKIKDNGTGIPDAIKEKIMQPFFTTKPTGEGTGLGLSLAYDMVVKGHGGEIEVNSKEGHYTEFIIKLPL